MRAPRSPQRHDRKAIGAFLCCRGRRGRRFTPQPVHLAHKQEDRQSHNQEVQDGIQKHAVVQRGRAGRLRLGQRGVALARQADEQLEKSVPPSSSPIGGMMTSLINELTI